MQGRVQDFESWVQYEELLKPRQVLLGETKSSPKISVKASTIPHVGRDGNHQLYYYYILG